MGYFRRQDNNAKSKEYKNDDVIIEDIAYNESEIEGESASIENINMSSPKNRTIVSVLRNSLFYAYICWHLYKIFFISITEHY